MVFRGTRYGCTCGTGFSITIRIYERFFLNGISPPGIRTIVSEGISPVQPNEDEPQGVANSHAIDFACEMTWVLHFR